MPNNVTWTERMGVKHGKSWTGNNPGRLQTLSAETPVCTVVSMACACILTMVSTWFVKWDMQYQHKLMHIQKERQLSQICWFQSFQFFQSKALSATGPQLTFLRHSGKGVQYLLFVTASNSKILKSQLSSLSRSCAIQGGTSLMVFGTDRWLWLRFVSVEMEFGN